jgi:hypothetical protein
MQRWSRACRRMDSRFRGSDGEGAEQRSEPDGAADQSPRRPPKRNGGRHRCRPPLSLGPFRSARRPLWLSQGGSGRGLAAPVGPSGSFAGILLFRFRFLRVPRPARRPATVPWRDPIVSVLRLRHSVPYRTSVEANFIGRPFAKPSARGLPVSPDPRRKVGSALACAAASRFFLPVARDLASIGIRPKTSAAFRGAATGRILRFRRPLPATRGHWHRRPSRGKP